MPDARQNAVVSGSLAEIRFVKSRSVAVLCVEIPIEAAEDAIGKFGIPLPGQEIPVAVARLNLGKEVSHVTGRLNESPPGSGLGAKDTGKSDRAKEAYRALDEMGRAVTRAGIMAADRNFWKWVGCSDEDGAAHYIRNSLGIDSRAKIGTDGAAYREYLNLEHQFAVYQGREAAPR